MLTWYKNSTCIFQFEYFVQSSFVLYSMAFRNQSIIEFFVSNIRLLLKEHTYLLRCWFHCDDAYYFKFRLCELFTVINSVTTIFLNEMRYKFTTIKCWLTLYLHMCVLYSMAFRNQSIIEFFVDPIQISCVSHSVDICTVAIKNIRNMHVVSTSQIADILHFNDNYR